jgi:hypothetical protein
MTGLAVRLSRRYGRGPCWSGTGHHRLFRIDSARRYRSQADWREVPSDVAISSHETPAARAAFTASVFTASK